MTDQDMIVAAAIVEQFLRLAGVCLTTEDRECLLRMYPYIQELVQELRIPEFADPLRTGRNYLSAAPRG